MLPQRNTVQLGKYVFLIVLYSFISPFIYAQNTQTATANISATVITDLIGANEFKSMEFTNIKGTPKDQLLKSTVLDSSAASFNLMSNSLYSISLPENDILLSVKGGTDTMKVGAFKVLSTNGSNGDTGQLVNIGATLKINPFQSPGMYHPNTSLRVTINYN